MRVPSVFRLGRVFMSGPCLDFGSDLKHLSLLASGANQLKSMLIDRDIGVSQCTYYMEVQK